MNQDIDTHREQIAARYAPRCLVQAAGCDTQCVFTYADDMYCEPLLDARSASQ